jgi:hypothetical protein
MRVRATDQLGGGRRNSAVSHGESFNAVVDVAHIGGVKYREPSLFTPPALFGPGQDTFSEAVVLRTHRTVSAPITCSASRRRHTRGQLDP